MNKELSPLEALKRFKNNIRWLQENTSLTTYFENEGLYLEEDLDNIETALKRLEKLEEEKQSFDRQLEKKLKALEIIKEIVKKDEETNFMSLFGNGMVNVGNSYEEIENKYNLLKEVLL